ncbi:unnamed protein product [Adineta steineri]|uniref:EF-hand domain-containing protein n=1 Tax=Adineta steineri TaxID=433720 RepID=A0A818N046_9BILA|nr:unnamed protein product [Adineta steineri]
MPYRLSIVKLSHIIARKITKDLKDFGIHSLKEDQHLEGLPLDRRGKINPEFHKEIFLGDHEVFESNIHQNERRRDKKLEEIFNEVDVDHDERLTKDELVNYLFKNIQQHLQKAKHKNSQLFILIDADQNGKITWQEYVLLYVKFHNKNISDIRDVNDVEFIPSSLDLESHQELLKIRYRWMQADQSSDNELNIDEFLAFRHPEITDRSAKYIADDLLLHMDQNNDQKINETEFVYIPSNISTDKNDTTWSEMDKKFVDAQKTEFHEFDENNDGILTRDEITKAYDPINRVHINIQVKRLFSKVDDSPADDSLSLKEIQKHADIFTDLSLLNTDRVLHEEM